MFDEPLKTLLLLRMRNQVLRCSYGASRCCYGNDTTADDDSTLPTVLIEGGEDTVEHSLWHFADEAVNNGSISRYCFVDRPGMAWVSSTSTLPDLLSPSLALLGNRVILDVASVIFWNESANS